MLCLFDQRGLSRPDRGLRRRLRVATPTPGPLLTSSICRHPLPQGFLSRCPSWARPSPHLTTVPQKPASINGNSLHRCGRARSGDASGCGSACVGPPPGQARLPVTPGPSPSSPRLHPKGPRLGPCLCREATGYGPESGMCQGVLCVSNLSTDMGRWGRGRENGI